MRLRSGGLKEWPAGFQNLSPISLLSIPITSHESGRHVDINVSSSASKWVRSLSSIPDTPKLQQTDLPIG